jgi:hypothetical protein
MSEKLPDIAFLDDVQKLQASLHTGPPVPVFLNIKEEVFRANERCRTCIPSALVIQLFLEIIADITA